MAMYVYPSGTEKEVKNAYIGEYVEAQANIDSDLRGATLAGLQAQGWTGIATRFASYVLDSNGLQPSSTHGDVAFLYKEFSDLSSANYIKIEVTGNVNNYTGSPGIIWEYLTNTTTFPSSFGNSLAGKYLSIGTASGGIIYNETLMSSSPSYTNGNHQATFEVNLQTGLCEYEITSPVSFSTTYTLNSTQLNTVKAYKYVGVMAQRMNNAQTIMYTAKLLVE